MGWERLGAAGGVTTFHLTSIIKSKTSVTEYPEPVGQPRVLQFDLLPQGSICPWQIIAFLVLKGLMKREFQSSTGKAFQ